VLIALHRWFDRQPARTRPRNAAFLPAATDGLFAAGVSGLTGIVGTFFVKDYLGLSAAFLAALGFWAGHPVGAEDADSGTWSTCCGATRPAWSIWAPR
jgi:hypothetical protein